MCLGVIFPLNNPSELYLQDLCRTYIQRIPGLRRQNIDANLAWWYLLTFKIL